MKYGIIAAILIVLTVPGWLDIYGVWKIPQHFIKIMELLFGPVGALSAVIMSIRGLFKDKYKYLAVITLLLSIVWIGLLLRWLILSPLMWL